MSVFTGPVQKSHCLFSFLKIDKFVVDENNIAHKTTVETGLENDTYIEITSGLSIGDTVVTKGQDFLSDGNTVNITNGTTKQESTAEETEQE